MARGSVGRPRARAKGFEAVSRAVVGGIRGHAGAWMFFGLVGMRSAIIESISAQTNVLAL